MAYAITPAPPIVGLRKHLGQHGCGSLAFSSLQQGLSYFYDDELGYMPIIKYQHWFWAKQGINIIIGDPICGPDKLGQFVDRYFETVGGTPTAFIHLSEQYAQILGKSYFLNPMGVEHEIDLTRFDLSLPGKDFTHIRRWRNSARKQGLEVREVSFCDIKVDQLVAVNNAWLKKKGGQEFVGLNRPLSIEDKPDVRYFCAFKGEELIGFAFFDPMYSQNRVTGYLHNIARIKPSAANGTNDLIILTAIERFQKEGINCLSLGLSPLADLPQKGEISHTSIQRLFRLMFAHLEFVYPFKGNYFHKQKYRANQKNIYMAMTPTTGIFRLLGVFRGLAIF